MVDWLMMVVMAVMVVMVLLKGGSPPAETENDIAKHLNLNHFG